MTAAEVTVSAELLVDPDGDAYARLLEDGKCIEERRIRRRSRPYREMVEEGERVVGEMFAAEMERRKQLPLFSHRVIVRNLKDRMEGKEGA